MIKFTVELKIQHLTSSVWALWFFWPNFVCCATVHENYFRSMTIKCEIIESKQWSGKLVKYISAATTGTLSGNVKFHDNKSDLGETTPSTSSSLLYESSVEHETSNMSTSSASSATELSCAVVESTDSDWTGVHHEYTAIDADQNQLIGPSESCPDGSEFACTDLTDKWPRRNWSF